MNQPSPNQPNILFIFPDQLRADFLSSYGGKMIDTPNIDSLIKGGIQYRRAYSASPLCVPARSSLLLGMNAIKTGVLDNSRFIRPDYREMGLRTWPELLNEAGYTTCAVGKMHFYPWDIGMGFQERIIAEDKRWPGIEDDYQLFLRERGLEKHHADTLEGYHENKGAVINKFSRKESVDHFVAVEAARWIKEYKDNAPMAMMVGFPGPHCPYDPHPEYLEQVRGEAVSYPIPAKPEVAPKTVKLNRSMNLRPWNGVDYSNARPEQYKKIRTHYAALVKQLDDEVGIIIQSLKDKGIWDDTVVIFAADHGDFLGDHGMVGKGAFFDPAMRVPLIVNAPETRRWRTGTGTEEADPERQVVDAPVQLRDITATILALAGVPKPSYMDSVELPGAITHSGTIYARDYIFGMLNDGYAVQRDNLRLGVYENGDVTLIDLEKDPEEIENLAKDPAYAKQMAELYGVLSREVISSVNFAHGEKMVYSAPPTEDESFGKRGWERAYPFPLSPEKGME